MAKYKAKYSYKEMQQYLGYYRKGGRSTFAQWMGRKSFGAMPWESRKQYLNLSPGDAAAVRKLLVPHRKEKRKIK